MTEEMLWQPGMGPIQRNGFSFTKWLGTQSNMKIVGSYSVRSAYRELEFNGTVDSALEGSHYAKTKEIAELYT